MVARRSADAHVRDDNGREHRPLSVQGKVESVDDGESQEAGDRHAQTEAQLGSVSANLAAKQAPNGIVIHAGYALCRGRSGSANLPGRDDGSRTSLCPTWTGFLKANLLNARMGAIASNKVAPWRRKVKAALVAAAAWLMTAARCFEPNAGAASQTGRLAMIERAP
jgi:hypothetical protein